MDRLVSDSLKTRSNHSGSDTIRVIVVDDHPVVRLGLEYMFSDDDSIEIVAQLAELDSLLPVIQSTQADVVLLDLELEHESGVEALLRVREQFPELRIVVYTAYADDDRVLQAIELGVDAYLLKGCRKEVLQRAIRTVHNGGSMLDLNIASRVMTHMRKRSSREKQNRGFGFSDRERQVLELLAVGKTNRQIGKQLFISESTVKFHMHSILEKLNANNRTEAVSIAVHHGLIDMHLAAGTR